MSHKILEELKYTKDHEWAQIDGEMASIGVSDFAQAALGDIVFVELPEKGTELKKGDAFGVVESIKSVSDLYSPISGEVVEVNEKLEDEPESLNSSPYDSWIVKVKIKNTSELDELLDSTAYKQHCEDEE